jgi:DNA-directed RNA polymerase subunit RPC12/RpoP
MSPEKTKALQDKYPKIFGTSDPSEPYTTYGIECGDGWYDLLDVLCRNIQHHVDWKIERIPEEEREGFQVVATQIKQKFSTLRFYYNGGDDYTSGLIQMAESMSGKICEDCGDKATVKTKGWITNICNSCHIKRFFKEKDFDLK